MRVSKPRWGEVTIKKQGSGGKNRFDKTKSFSIEDVRYNYSIDEYYQLLRSITDLTERLSFSKLRASLEKIKKEAGKDE